MSEYLIQDTTLTSIATPLRTLGETTGTKTPAQMAAIATDANTTIATQGTLLDEAIEALEGKISPASKLESKTLTLGAEAPSTITPSTGYDGLSSVPVVLDTSVIKAENIAKDVMMLGVTGTHEGGGGGYEPGQVEFGSGPTYRLFGEYTWETILNSLPTSYDLRGATLFGTSEGIYSVIYIVGNEDIDLNNYSNGEIDGLTFCGFEFRYIDGVQGGYPVIGNNVNANIKFLQCAFKDFGQPITSNDFRGQIYLASCTTYRD